MNQYYKDQDNDNQVGKVYYAEVRDVAARNIGDSQEKKNKNSNKKLFALMLCTSVIISSVTGFGAGYLGANMNQQSLEAPLTPNNESNYASQVIANPTASSEAMSVSEVVTAVSNTVVEITIETASIDGGYFLPEIPGNSGSGSGVIITEDGYIVTNNHVVQGAEKISVRMQDGETHDATLIETDKATDVAVIKIEATGLPAAPIGSSADLGVGDVVIAIGNSLGELGGTVTDGIISATSREVEIGEYTMSLLQTNAAINPGNSGGGLFNNKGELIGIVVAKSTGWDVEGLGFAIPIDTAKTVADNLIDFGYVKGRGQLGIGVREVFTSDDMFISGVSTPGVYIANVVRDSGADIAGLQVRDAIISVNGEKIESSSQLISIIGKHKAGDSLEMEIDRDNEIIIITVVLQELIPDHILEQSKDA